MKKRKLFTSEEYQTRAMLLGPRWHYDPEYHHLRQTGAHGGIGTVWYLDPDTLEPLTGRQAWDRKRTQLRGPKS